MKSLRQLFYRVCIQPALGIGFAGGIDLARTAANLKCGTISDPAHMESLRAQAAEAMPAITPPPATAASAGSPGQLAYDATHVYICVANNTWVRALLATF